MDCGSSAATKALVLAPHGRDATIASSLLQDIGIGSRTFPTLAALCEALHEDIHFAVLAEEALQSADLRAIADWVRSQPAWSDLPFIVLTHHTGGTGYHPDTPRLAGLLRNVTFLERPFHPLTFASVANTAFKGRQRQYEAGARMEELRESDHRLRTALMAGRLGSWEMDLPSRMLTTSPTFDLLFGRRWQETISLDQVVAEVHADDRARLEQAIQNIIETSTEEPIEFRHIRGDGEVRWIELRGRLVHSRSGDGTRLAGVSSDITHRKSEEQRLKWLNERLEARVAERTLELKKAHAAVLAEIEQRKRTEERLRQSQKLEMIGQLTGGVAHDFNNLLMAVVGNLDLLRKSVIEPRLLRLIDGAMQGAHRGAALTQRLLAFARRQDLAVEPTNLAELVRGMIDLIERSVGKEVELTIRIPADLPPVLADANQVELALLNLVVNARDAMPSGGQLTIDLSHAKAGNQVFLSPGAYVCLSVTDTGSGMDEETLRRATEPFFSTKELGKGTGLGLSMIHGLAVQLGGALQLNSEIGQGTRAELWLPVTNKQANHQKAEADKPVEGSGLKLTILVVDDDALISMSTVAMVEDLGHEVLEANSGAQALDILRKDRRVDLLISDYSMPKMNGGQLAKAARAIRPQLPILLATGYAELPSDADASIPRIGKPYQQSQLATAIAGVLKVRTVVS